MFTGIIEKVARITTIESGEKQSRLTIETTYSDLQLGESVAVNGVCLTVAEVTSQTGSKEGNALFFLSSETLARSNLSRLKAGSRVNLERAIQGGTRLSGHIVQGHVDGIAELAKVELQSESHLLELELPRDLARYCVEKGSISLNGVSLTINRIQDTESGARISITLVPHTWNHTNFSEYQPGDSINVEVDVLAKYVEKLCHPYLGTCSTRSNN